MKLYMVRHGQSANNLAHRHAGWSKTELTEQGVEDARRAGKILETVRFDKIYTSDLPRTIQTCQNALPGREWEAWELIREINVGALQDRLVADCAAEYGEKYLESRKIHDYTPWGGENKDLLKIRAAQFLKIMESAEFETVAAFSHGVFIRCCMEVALNGNLAPGSILNNGGIAVFEFKDGSWSVEIPQE